MPSAELLDLLGITTGDRVLLAHAHPDDETLASGALIAELVSLGVPTELVTATRGERGEVVPGSLPAGVDLVTRRMAERDAAAGVLGLSSSHWLGTAPALASGRAPRDYPDSGMQWQADGRAGPDPAAPADAFARVDPGGPVADLSALIEALGVTVLISYDPGGGYGHPDHVRMHEVARAAAENSRVAFWMLAPEGPDQAASPVDERYRWIALPQHRDRVLAALDCYRTQLRVVDGVIVHVGGQHQRVTLAAGLARERH